ncbi:MAG: inosine 5-monophosphate dehydrogenase [Gemmataceae bacterium]|nr:inosine 5-monophosphate dehydrogenase [Gemmataceae bacterium]
MAPPLLLLAETAGDLMTPSPVSIDATTTTVEAARVLTSRAIGAAVVIDQAGHPIGVVTKTDLLIHAPGRDLEQDPTPVRAVMTDAVFSVRMDTPARSVIDHLLALNVHHLFVTDGSDVLVGVISPIDVLRKLG